MSKKDHDGVYEFDSDDLGWCFVHGSYRDQNCITLTFKGTKERLQFNHKDGEFKINPMVLAKFLKEIGVTFHGKTQRKHTYIEEIRLKPWSEFEHSIRQGKEKSQS